MKRAATRPTTGAAIAALGLLAGCHSTAKVENGNMTTASITIGNTQNGNGGSATQSVSINVPGFSAKVNVPDLNLGSDRTQIENMKLFPGTHVADVKITGDAGDGSGGNGKGRVDMGFTAPGNPTAIVAWYKDQAGRNGWTIVPPSGANQFEATRSADGRTTHFALQVGTGPGGSSGRFQVDGS